jgi:hypothetical protein
VFRLIPIDLCFLFQGTQRNNISENKNDDQVDLTSHALDWIKKGGGILYELIGYVKGIEQGIYPPILNVWPRRF